MYLYVNTTEVALEQNFTRLQELREKVQNGTGKPANKLGVWTGPLRINPALWPFSLYLPGLQKMFHLLKPVFVPSLFAETEPLPPELQPILEDSLENVTQADPVVQAFLHRQRRLEELQRRRNATLAERLQRLISKKYFIFRRR